MYQTNDLESFWMPFTPNRQFKKRGERIMTSAEGAHYTDERGKKILDGVAGLWCCNAGHSHPKIVEAIREQAGKLDFAPSFNTAHSLAFQAANRLVNMLPDPLNYAFFTNSGSESADTSMKIALGYHTARGEGGRRAFVSRTRGYHGVNIGGTAITGIAPNRKMFGHMMNGVYHLPPTHDLARNAYSRGQPEHGADFADRLEEIVALHDPSTIAAVIVEPVAGSGGVLIPPKGYLERIRAITEKHGILLIFDEVITGFGRLGTPFATDYFGVVPDIANFAKGITSGTVPMGAVAVQSGIYDAFMQGPEEMIEFAHGYTYTAHPLACAAMLATMEVYEEENLFTAGSMERNGKVLEDAVHSLRDEPNVIDTRNLGMIAGVEVSTRDGKPTARALDILRHAYNENQVLVRTTGDTIAFSPPLIFTEAHIHEMIEAVRAALRAVD